MLWNHHIGIGIALCEVNRGFNKTVIAKVWVKGDIGIGETEEDFICATLDWWPPNKCDYGTCSWGNASLLNLVILINCTPLIFHFILLFLYSSKIICP
jgi:hypothetical protein